MRKGKRTTCVVFAGNRRESGAHTKHVAKKISKQHGHYFFYFFYRELQFFGRNLTLRGF